MEGRENYLKQAPKWITTLTVYNRSCSIGDYWPPCFMKILSENPHCRLNLLSKRHSSALNFALRHKEDAIGALEKSIVTTIRLDCINTAHESTTRNLVATTRISEGLARYYYGDLVRAKRRYEAARLNICARRLQYLCLQKFSSYSSAVPSAIRRAMSLSYSQSLRGR